MTLGGVDASKFTGKLTTFANVNTQGFWAGAMDAVSVNGKSLDLKNRTAILDTGARERLWRKAEADRSATGTTLIVAPAADATAIHAAIPGAKSDGQGAFTVPCTTEAVVALSFGGVAFSIDPRDLACV